MLKVYEKEFLNIKEVEENKKFFYFDVGAEYHGRNTYRVWVHRNLVKIKEIKTKEGEKLYDYFIEYPVFANIEKGKNDKTLIMRPSLDFYIINIYVKCGYRGSSKIILINDEIKKYEYSIFHSPRGSLGISEGALLVIPVNLKEFYVKLKRSGRLYGGSSSGIVKFTFKDKEFNYSLMEDIELEDLEKLE